MVWRNREESIRVNLKENACTVLAMLPMTAGNTAWSSDIADPQGTKCAWSRGPFGSNLVSRDYVDDGVAC